MSVPLLTNQVEAERKTHGSFFDGPGDPKSDEARARVGRKRMEVERDGAGRAIPIGPAADDALPKRGLDSLCVANACLPAPSGTIFIQPILAPFHHVAVDVEESQRVGLQRSDRPQMPR